MTSLTKELYGEDKTAAFQKALAEIIDPRDYHRYFSRLKLVGKIVVAPTAIEKYWIEEHFRRQLTKAAQQAGSDFAGVALG